MSPRYWLPLLIGIWSLPANVAQAHFLFIRILPPAEGGRAATLCPAVPFAGSDASPPGGPTRSPAAL